jgi:uncharacterized protein (TIRG00374 family)
VARGYYLSRKISNTLISAATVVVDRVMGLFSLLFMCIISLMIGDDLFDHSVTLYALLLLLLTCAAAFFIFYKHMPDILEERISFLPNTTVGRNVLKMHRTFHEFSRDPLLMTQSFVYSIILQIIRVITIYVTALAFSVDVELGKVFLIVPVSVLIIMIPISVGGLGVREGALVALFSLVSVSINDSFAISSVNSIMVTFIALMGGFFVLAYNTHPDDASIS